ncbi:MAG TPA: hypothetical protein EYG71_07750 [Leucothrix sp.]|nr:hypothetical protein [Leucothrix sp.]
MAQDGKMPADMLRYMVLDLGNEQQLELMKLFAEAFDVTLGEVTAISAWWHDDTAELNDRDINAYMMPIIKGFLEQKK